MHQVIASRTGAARVAVLWTFLATAAHAAQVGVWQFNDNLNNAVGGRAALSAFGGWDPAYVTETIGGSAARVLNFPQLTDTQALDMPNQAGPNGPNSLATSSSLNNWSIVMDVKFPAVGNFTSLWETSDLGVNDGDYFVRAVEGIGISQQYGGTYVPSDWNRVAVTVDAAVTPGVYTLTGYINGVPTGVVATTDAAPNGREAIKDVLHLFTDDDFETSAGLINSLAFYGQVLDATTVGALAGPAAAGIPAAANQVGRWQFDGNLDNAIAGRAAMSAAGGWEASYASETIGGSPAQVLSFPAFDPAQALDMPNQANPDYSSEPPAPPTTTNVWSLVMDVKFPVIAGFTSLFETNDLLGVSDGDYFIRGDFDGIGTSGQYSGSFASDAWTRLAVTVDGSLGGEGYVVTGYIDGVLVGTAVTSASPNGKEGVKAILHLFADDDGENAAGLINSLAYYDELLTPEAIAALGGATAAGVPVTAAPVDPDFNNDGSVDGADLLDWQRGLGVAAGASNAQGDADGNAAVNAADLLIWQGSFGIPAAAAAAAVPEPATALLTALAGASLFRRSRRHS